MIGYVDLQYPGFNLLSSGTAAAPCSTDAGNLAVLDLDGNGALNSADTLFLANYLFSAGPPPVQGTGCFAVPASGGCASTCQ